MINKMKRQLHSIMSGYSGSGIMAIMLIALIILPFSKCFSNNLTVGSLVVDQPNQKVTFVLAWNNSWRSSGTTAKNWDAAWVFVKFRACTANNSFPYTHGLVSTVLTDHDFQVGGVGTQFQP